MTNKTNWKKILLKNIDKNVNCKDTKINIKNNIKPTFKFIEPASLAIPNYIPKPFNTSISFKEFYNNYENELYDLYDLIHYGIKINNKVLNNSNIKNINFHDFAFFIFNNSSRNLKII